MPESNRITREDIAAAFGFTLEEIGIDPHVHCANRFEYDNAAREEVFRASDRLDALVLSTAYLCGPPPPSNGLPEWYRQMEERDVERRRTLRNRIFGSSADYLGPDQMQVKFDLIPTDICWKKVSGIECGEPSDSESETGMCITHRQEIRDNLKAKLN